MILFIVFVVDNDGYAVVVGVDVMLATVKVVIVVLYLVVYDVVVAVFVGVDMLQFDDDVSC